MSVPMFNGRGALVFPGFFTRRKWGGGGPAAVNPALASFAASVGAVRGGTSFARIACIGDSNTAGGYTDGVNAWANGGRAQSWPTILTSLLNSAGLPSNSASSSADQRHFNPASTGALSGLAAWDPRLSFGAGWSSTSGVLSLGGVSLANSTDTSGITFTPGVTFDTVDVYYISNTSGIGTGGVWVGGSLLGTFVGGGQSAAVRKYTVSAPAGSTSVMVTRQSGSTVHIVGIQVYNAATKQVFVANFGVGSVNSSGVSDTSSGWSARNALAAYAPNLSVIMLGLNDLANGIADTTFSTNMQNIITTAKTSGDVVLCTWIPPQIGFTANVTQVRIDAFIAAINSLATSNSSPLVDIYTRWGSSYAAAQALGFVSNGLHPNAAGYADIAAAAKGVILQ